jgi:ubiquinone/menaquinone biosynthesis C-methylase UbiE
MKEQSMAFYPVESPSMLEMILFDAGLVTQIPLAEIYDVKAGTTAQRTSLDPKRYRSMPDIHDPKGWANEFWANTRWEWFAYMLRDCQRVLDIGCGEGRPSLYLSRYIPKVIGLDISPAHITLARNAAKQFDLSGVVFEVGNIETLRFPDASFDGVCFGGNVFTYNCDVPRMLNQIHRVLRPGGSFAFEQCPGNPDMLHQERILWFIDGGPPIIHYGVSQGLYSRSYFIYVKPDSRQGQRLSEVATRITALLTDEQQHACEEIIDQIRKGNVSMVDQVTYSGQDRTIAAEELPGLLADAGFVDTTYWVVPDGLAFAESLQQSSVLNRLIQDDLLPYLRALVASSPQVDHWIESVTCRKTK